MRQSLRRRSDLAFSAEIRHGGAWGRIEADAGDDGMTMKSLFVAAAFGAVIAASPATAQSATDYNIYTLQNLTTNGGGIAGKVAVGGNANLTSSSIANGAADGQTTLAVGGNLTANQGALAHGNAQVGGTANYGTNYANNGTVTAGSNPLNFAAENNRLATLSDTLATYASTGTATNEYGNLKLTGTASGLNVFNIAASDLSGWGLSISSPTGSQVLINVSGTSATLSQTMQLSGIVSTMILFNFYEANSLNLSNFVQGSILATDANVSFGSGQMDGTLIAGSLNSGSVGYNGLGYQGSLLAAAAAPASSVPEPASWAMMIGGFLLVGGLLRRSKAVARLISAPEQLHS
jgi:choice-of-anchor A domain-containing protein